MKLGRPESLLDKSAVRLTAIDRAIAQFTHSSIQLMAPYRHMVDEHTTMYLKGFGNEVNLLSALRDLYFNSRELLDLLLAHIANATRTSGAQTPRDFMPFAKALVAGDLSRHKLKILTFLKNNITYIFHIRSIRNEIKRDPSGVEFNFNTSHFEARMRLPVKESEKILLQHLDIKNINEALKNRSYSCTLILDIAFPEMKDFWLAANEVKARDGL
jgi:hypothetical protein